MSIVQLLINAAKTAGSIVQQIVYKDFVEQDIFRSNDIQASDYFGQDVAISSDGTRCVVGAFTEDGASADQNDNRGAAYVFIRSGNGWVQEAKLAGSDTATGDYFGFYVAISDDGSRVIISGERNNNNIGAAYVFSRSGTTWSQEAKLVGSDIVTGDFFGSDVAISGDGSRVIVGCDLYDGTGNTLANSGAAYVFSRSGTTWAEEAKLTSTDIQSGDRFGTSVSITSDGTRVLVTADNEDGGAGDPHVSAGAAYVFSRSGTTWTEEQILRASDAATGDVFGRTAEISGDGTRCVVSAYLEDGASADTNDNRGAAYVFSRSGTTWTEEQKLTASDGQTNDRYGDHSGLTISNDGTRIVVGVPNEDGGAGDPSANAGAAYVYSRDGTTWTETEILRASDADASDNFGHAVSLSGDGTLLIVSAVYEHAGASNINDAGSAYFFDASYIFAEEQKLTASDGQANDDFGGAVSITSDGTRVIVSAELEDGASADTNDNRGAAYVFSRSGTTWTQEQKLSASDAATGDVFGRDVAISDDGTRCIVGAYREDGSGDSRGAAYVFSRSGTTWTQEQKLTASDTQDSDSFGSAVSISEDGSRVAVGTQSAEAVYVYSRSGTTWSQEQILTASDGEANDSFGYFSISLTGDATRLVVGAYTEDGGDGNPISNAGAAYVFSRSGTTWTQEQKLTASDAQASDFLGLAVDISEDGSRVVAGARGVNSLTGAAYVFSRSGTTWTQEQKLTASDAIVGDYFGQAVSISGNGTSIVVGAFGEDDSGVDAGAAYLYSRSGTTWTEEQKIEHSDAQTSDQFGVNVAISTDKTRIIIGAIGGNSATGKAYVFNTP